MDDTKRKPSGAERYLKGKTPPNTTKSIKQIDVAGNHRIIHYADGSIRRVSKAQLMGIFAATLNDGQRRDMKKTMRLHKNGAVTLKLGGMSKGKVKTYKSIESAKRALARRYPKINTNPHEKSAHGTVNASHLPHIRALQHSKAGHHSVPPLLGGRPDQIGTARNTGQNPQIMGRDVLGVRIRPKANS